MNKTGILAEIQRTAAENGGAPLGRRRFETDTGIKQAEWLGVHWARWSDAVQEAGFQPNRLQAPYPTDLLLTRYAELTLELARIPARSSVESSCRAKEKGNMLRCSGRMKSTPEKLERNHEP